MHCTAVHHKLHTMRTGTVELHLRLIAEHNIIVQPLAEQHQHAHWHPMDLLYPTVRSANGQQVLIQAHNMQRVQVIHIQVLPGHTAKHTTCMQLHHAVRDTATPTVAYVQLILIL